jgi:hypothetical protein
MAEEVLLDRLRFSTWGLDFSDTRFPKASFDGRLSSSAAEWNLDNMSMILFRNATYQIVNK